MKQLAQGMHEVEADESIFVFCDNIYERFYCREMMIFIKVYREEIIITSIRNAQRVGKTCNVFHFKITKGQSDYAFIIWAFNNGVQTVQEFVEFLITEKDCEWFTERKYTKRGIDVYSPYHQQKPIPRPKKWTKAHVVKMLFSGQIDKAEGNGRYTDDYLYDSSVNFGIGKAIDLHMLACDLVEESSSGLTFSDKGDYLSLGNHSFDYKKLYFAKGV